MSLRDEIRKQLRDIDMNFLQTVCVEAFWQYTELSKELFGRPELSPQEKNDLFMRLRGDRFNSALKRSAQQHGVPFDVKRLPCNGQNKVLVKTGRVVIIQETLEGLREHPKAANYKVQLAASYGVIQQLELDLGDQPNKILDWQDSRLAVLLHGTSGTMLHSNEVQLGGLFLAVPDIKYENWIMRFDLLSAALHGFQLGSEEQTSSQRTIQQDKVRIALRSHRKRVGGR